MHGSHPCFVVSELACLLFSGCRYRSFRFRHRHCHMHGDDAGSDDADGDRDCDHDDENDAEVGIRPNDDNDDDYVDVAMTIESTIMTSMRMKTMRSTMMVVVISAMTLLAIIEQKC